MFGIGHLPRSRHLHEILWYTLYAYWARIELSNIHSPNLVPASISGYNYMYMYDNLFVLAVDSTFDLPWLVYLKEPWGLKNWNWLPLDQVWSQHGMSNSWPWNVHVALWWYWFPVFVTKQEACFPSHGLASVLQLMLILMMTIYPLVKWSSNLLKRW